MIWAVSVVSAVSPMDTIPAGVDRGADDNSMEMATHMDAFALDRELAIEQMQDADNPLCRDGDPCALVPDEWDTMLANGATPELAGTDAYTPIDIQKTSLEGPFTENRPSCRRWVECRWPSPATESPEGELNPTWIRTGPACLFVGIFQ